MAPLRVVVVDDSTLIRAGVARVLGDAGCEVVAELPDATEVMETVASLHPDVVVVDIRMPPTRTDEGVRAALAIRAGHPGTGVVVLSAFAEPDYVQDLLGGGSEGIGYLLKDRIGDIDDFLASVRMVARGGTVLDPAVVALLVARDARRDRAAAVANEDRAPAASAPDMDELMVEHAAAWAREHGCGVAREVVNGFVAVLPDGRNSRHQHFYQALEWLDAHGVPRAG